MTGEGIVVSVKDDIATVRIEKKSACSGDCSSCGLCNSPVYDIEVANPIAAKAGDKVRLNMNTGKVFASAFLVYMLPVLIILTVLGISSALGFENYVSGILCAFSLALWFWMIRIYNKRAKLDSTITEIIE